MKRRPFLCAAVMAVFFIAVASLGAGQPPTLSASPSAVNPADEITVVYSGAPGFDTDWIAIYRIDEANERYGEWSYLRGEKSGTLTFTAPQELGDYEFRMFENWAGSGSYEEIARSNPVSVVLREPSPAANGEIEENVVARYHFDGDADDATGRHPGELFGDASFVAEEGSAPALKLDGSGDYVRVGNVHQDPTRDLSQGSIEMWVKLESAPTNFVLAASGREYGGSFDDGFYLGTHSSYSKNLVFMIWAGGWKVADSGIPPEDLIGEWRHVMGTWGPRGLEIWVDGILRGTKPHTGGLPNPNYATVLIGTDSWRWDTHGLIGGVAIYDVQKFFSDESIDGSEEMGHVGGRPKCADFDCRDGAPCQSFDPLPEDVVDYADLGATSPERKTAGPLLDPETYMIWSGKRVSGYIGVSDDWKAYGPFTLKGGTSYLFDVYEGTLKAVAPEELSSMLDQVGPSQARLWYQRSAADPYVLCVEMADAP